MVEYFGFYFGILLNGESMEIKPFKKTDAKLHFLYRQNKSLNNILNRNIQLAAKIC